MPQSCHSFPPEQVAGFGDRFRDHQAGRKKEEGREGEREGNHKGTLGSNVL